MKSVLLSEFRSDRQDNIANELNGDATPKRNKKGKGKEGKRKRFPSPHGTSVILGIVKGTSRVRKTESGQGGIEARENARFRQEQHMSLVRSSPLFRKRGRVPNSGLRAENLFSKRTFHPSVFRYVSRGEGKSGALLLGGLGLTVQSGFFPFPLPFLIMMMFQIRMS